MTQCPICQCANIDLDTPEGRAHLAECRDRVEAEWREHPMTVEPFVPCDSRPTQGAAEFLKHLEAGGSPPP